jgi:hypothetical protein
LPSKIKISNLREGGENSPRPPDNSQPTGTQAGKSLKKEILWKTKAPGGINWVNPNTVVN